jgi:autotransporter translocation and assembly factor TamB
VTGTSLSGARTEWDIRELSVGAGSSRVSGRLTAITDIYRGLGFRDLRLTLQNLNLDVPRAYLDTLPFHGTVSGALEADGFFDRMTVALDWEFTDSLVAGGATSRISLAGPLRFATEGLAFENAALRSSDVDLRTVQVQAPAVVLQGRLAAEGTLNGPLDNVEFQGTAVHRDGDGPASRLTGLVRLDTRGEVLGLSTDVVLDSLVFAGIQPSFPSLDARGALGGTAKLDGTLEHLAVDLDVGGGLGQVRAQGAVTLSPPHYGADSLRVSFARFDLSNLVRTAPATRLTGRLFASGRADAGAAPVGNLSMQLGRGTVAGFTLDSTQVVLHAGDSLITVDTVVTEWRGGRLDGHGAIGWTSPRSGDATFHVEATSLAVFDSLALAVTGLTRDTTPGLDAPLGGRGQADVVLSGALPGLRVRGTATFDSLRWLGYRARIASAALDWNRGDSTLTAQVAADSFWLRTLRYSGVTARVAGRTDSMSWTAAIAAGEMGSARGGGRLQRLPDATLLGADSLALDLAGRAWALDRPMTARITDSVIAMDTARLVTADRSGSIELAGSIPRAGPGALTLNAVGVELRDIYGLLQRDTTGVGGVVAADVGLQGTARQPELQGKASLTGGRIGDFQAPLIRTTFDYRDHLLQSDLTFWRDGTSIVEVNARLPLDLALSGAKTRQLPGPLNIVAKGDSVDLAILEAFTPNLRQVTGRLDLDARVEGQWDSPRLAGSARVRDGAATVPDLGVRYEEIRGTVLLSGDSLTTDSLHLGGRFGHLDIEGGIRLERLTRPVFNLRLAGEDFEVMNVPDFMAIRATTDLRLSGSVFHPNLTGSSRITNSVIYFADLVEKDIVNLEDPLFADLVDTLALRRYNLGAAFQSRFLDSLAIRDLRLDIGEGVWLRSAEANFQLEGNLLVNKVPLREGVRYPYRLDGDLDVPRGTYTLRAGGVINRTFTVERGAVRYFGDLNADLDIQARHIVRAPQRGTEDIPVIVHITGTLEVPKLTLTTPPDRPPMTEGQLISLLTVGTADPLALGTREQQAAFLRSVAVNALASELQRSLVSTERAPFDVLEIRPGISSGPVGSSSPTQLAVGRALTNNLFVTANAGFCLGSGQATFNARNLGATLEYRFNPVLRGQLSAEPVQTCLARGVDIFGTTRRYQFGAELRWDRGY